MKKQTGIWLDKEKAVIIKLKEEKHTIAYLDSGIVFKERVAGEGKKFGRMGEQFLNMESKKENKFKQQTSDYLKRILLEIKNSDEIVLFGPAEMKKMLEKALLEDRELSKKLLAVKTADSMTENQMLAWVRKFYSE